MSVICTEAQRHRGARGERREARGERREARGERRGARGERRDSQLSAFRFGPGRASPSGARHAGRLAPDPEGGGSRNAENTRRASCALARDGLRSLAKPPSRRAARTRRRWIGKAGTTALTLAVFAVFPLFHFSFLHNKISRKAAKSAKRNAWEDGYDKPNPWRSLRLGEKQFWGSLAKLPGGEEDGWERPRRHGVYCRICVYPRASAVPSSDRRNRR